MRDLEGPEPFCERKEFQDCYPDFLKLLSLSEETRKKEGVCLPLLGQVEEPLPEEQCHIEQTEEQCDVYQPQPEKLCTC